MPEQLSLFGSDPPKESLFFAIVPDAAAAKRLSWHAEELRREYGAKGANMDDRFHVSLHNLGVHHELPGRLIASTSDVAQTIRVASYEVTFDRIRNFGNPLKPAIVLAGGDFRALAAFDKLLGAAFTKAGIKGRAVSRLTPHLTLFHADRPVPEHDVEPVSWTVREFVLIHSQIGKGRHIVLGRWSLRG